MSKKNHNGNGTTVNQNTEEAKTETQNQEEQPEPEKVSGTVIDKNGKEIKEKKTLKQRLEATPKWLRTLGLVGVSALGGAVLMAIFGGGSSANDDDNDGYYDEDDCDDSEDDYSEVGSDPMMSDVSDSDE